MARVLVSAAAGEPVTADQLLDWLRVTDTAEIPVIDAMAQAAREFVETYTGRQLLTATWRQTWPGFSPRLHLRPNPVQSLTAVTYYDSNETLQTIATGDVLLNSDTEPAVIEHSDVWPATDDRAGAVSVAFKAGYGDDAGDVPAPLLTAIKMLVGHQYENREAVTVTQLYAVPIGVRELLNAYRVQEF